MAATDERAIHEFPTGTIDENSLLIMDRPTATPGEYETEKFAIANLGLKLLGGIDFPSNLDTDEKDIFGAINEVNAKAMNIEAEYDETASYSKGDYCIYQNAAYRCVKASGTTTGTFVASDWTQIKVLEEVKANTGAINELNTTLTPVPITINNRETASMTIVDNTSYSMGKLVIVNIRINVTTQINGGRPIIDGLPKSTTSLTSGSSFGSLASIRADNAFSLANYENDTGVLTINTLTPQSYCMSGCYIKA